MGLRISFELSDRDLAFFRKALRQSRAAVQHAEDAEIIDAIHAVLEEIRASEPLPDFVGRRIPELESLLRMLDALQQSETALQKGLSEKVNFEVALLRAVEAGQVRAIENLFRELKGLQTGAADPDGKKKA